MGNVCHKSQPTDVTTADDGKEALNRYAFVNVFLQALFLFYNVF